jgi:hypothetical protein
MRGYMVQEVVGDYASDVDAEAEEEEQEIQRQELNEMITGLRGLGWQSLV